MIQTMSLPQRLGRWLVAASMLTVFSLGIAGRTDLPMLNAFVGLCVVLLLADGRNVAS